jgi:hypothetical protein
MIDCTYAKLQNAESLVAHLETQLKLVGMHRHLNIRTLNVNSPNVTFGECSMSWNAWSFSGFLN